MLDLDHRGGASSAFQLRSGSLGLQIRFSSEASAAITEEIGVGFLSIPRRGAEVGGLLGGELEKRGSEWLVTVHQIVPVPIEYQYGPSWRLSAGDRQQFHDLVRKGMDGARLIGWYRSNTRPEHEPEEADRLISQKFFSDGPSVFLFCEPSADGRIGATCNIILPRGEQSAFRFDLGRFVRMERPLLSHAAADVAPIHSAAVPDPPAPRALEKPPAEAVSPKTGRNASVSRYTRIAAGALLLVGFAWYARSRPANISLPDHAGSVVAAASPSRPTPDGAILGLRADYQGNSLLIGWDRNSPAIASAASAVFTIADGARTRTLNLSAAELQHGSILYKPHADEIKVDLSVTSPAGQTAEQWIRILEADPAPEAGEARKAPRVIAQTPVTGTSLPQDIPATPAPAAAFEEPVRTPQRIAAPNIDVAAPDLNPGSPEINMGVPKLVAGNLPANIPRAAPPVPVPQPPARVRELRPATPLHAPQPTLPPGVNLPDYAFDRPFQVQVEVSINVSGRVTAAHLVGSAGPYASLLGAWALNTARLWTFHPATLGGEPVPSTMVLTFHYTRPR
jgi:hypothetical protein